MRLAIRAVIVVFFAATAFTRIYAQGSTASLAGTVRDEQGLVVPGVMVTLAGTENTFSRTVTTSDDGGFELPGLLPGDYKMTVELSGFTRQDLAVHIEVNQRVRTDVVLKAGGLTQQVQVTETVPLLHVSDANRDDPTDNYLDTRAHDFENNGYNIRLDRAWGNGTLLDGRYSLSDETGFTPQNLPGFGAYHDNRVHNLTVTLLNPTTKRLLTETRFGFARMRMHRYGESANGTNHIAQLGIPGVGYGGEDAYGLPGLKKMALALDREIPLNGALKFHFRLEAFNLFNTVNYSTPNRFVNTPQFGTITEAATSARQIQLFSARPSRFNRVHDTNRYSCRRDDSGRQLSLDQSGRHRYMTAARR